MPEQNYYVKVTFENKTNFSPKKQKLTKEGKYRKKQKLTKEGSGRYDPRSLGNNNGYSCTEFD